MSIKPNFQRNRLTAKPPEQSQVGGMRDLLLLMEDTEQLQRRLADNRRELFEDHLDRSPALYDVWQRFMACGGVTADELRAFVRGEIDGKARVITRAHRRLRLVHTKPPPKRKSIPRVMLKKKVNLKARKTK